MFLLAELFYISSSQVESVIEDVLNFSVSQKLSTTNSTCQLSCLSIWCTSCRDHQDRALRQVSSLIQRIDEAESLFPSTHKMMTLYPAWGGGEFTTRCRTLYLWYNTTLHLRQTIALLGNRLQHIAKSAIPWPTFLPINEIIPSPMSTTQRTFSSEDDSSSSNKPNNAASSKQSSSEIDPQQDDFIGSPIKLVIDEADDGTENDVPSTQNSVRFTLEVNSSSNDASTATEVEAPSVQSKRDRFADAGRSESNSSLLSADGVPEGECLKRSSSTLFLAANPYR